MPSASFCDAAMLLIAISTASASFAARPAAFPRLGIAAPSRAGPLVATSGIAAPSRAGPLVATSGDEDYSGAAAGAEAYESYWEPHESTGAAFRDRVPLSSFGVRTIVDVLRGKYRFQRVPCPGNEDDETCFVLVGGGTESLVAPYSRWTKTVTACYFAVWFALSIGYSITNKQVTNVLVLPWTMAAAVALVGALLVQALWSSGLRAPPRLSASGWWGLAGLGTFHAIAHIAGTVGTTYGSVSFAQVVKAAGPVYACILSSLVLRERVSRRVWFSLLPIIGGVGLATLKELTFAWAALIGAVVSDLGLAFRNARALPFYSTPWPTTAAPLRSPFPSAFLKYALPRGVCVAGAVEAADGATEGSDARGPRRDEYDPCQYVWRTSAGHVSGAFPVHAVTLPYSARWARVYPRMAGAFCQLGAHRPCHRDLHPRRPRRRGGHYARRVGLRSGCHPRRRRRAHLEDCGHGAVLLRLLRGAPGQPLGPVLYHS